MRANEFINEGVFDVAANAYDKLKYNPVTNLGRRALLKTFGIGGQPAIQAQYEADFRKKFKQEYYLASKNAGSAFDPDDFFAQYLQKYKVNPTPKMMQTLKSAISNPNDLSKKMYYYVTQAGATTANTPAPAGATAKPRKQKQQPQTQQGQEPVAEPTQQPAPATATQPKTPEQTRIEKQRLAAQAAQGEMMPYSQLERPAVWKSNRAPAGTPASIGPQQAAQTAQQMQTTNQPAVWSNVRNPNQPAQTSPQAAAPTQLPTGPNFAQTTTRPNYQQPTYNVPTGIPNTSIRQPATRVKPTQGYQKPRYNAPQAVPNPGSLAAALKKAKPTA